MKNSARKPADLTTTSVGCKLSDHSNVESLSSNLASRLCAITIVNEVRYAGLLSRMSSRFEVSALLSTLSLSSASNRTASSARDFPMLDGPSRKKLFPASSGDTCALSRMVKWPIPGSTRFFRIEVDVADPEMTKMREFSSALWPVAAHRLKVRVRCSTSNIDSKETYRSWRSYRLVLLSGCALLLISP